MAHTILALADLTHEQTKSLSERDFIILSPIDIQEKDYASIEIMYGWEPILGQKILSTPNHKLQWIQSISAGVDYFPLQQLKDANIILTNASGLKSVPIAQSVLGYILYFARGLDYYNKQQSWQTMLDQYSIAELPTLIFGTGQIGQEIARQLKALGGTVYGVNSTGHPANNFDKTFALNNYQDALNQVQTIVNVLPSTNETEAFFNQAFFAQLDQAFLYINVGRGTTTDASALLSALNQHQVRHAALDVTTPEPLPADSPLWNHPQLLLTQHTSWVEHNAQTPASNLFDIFEQNISNYLTGQPLTINVVNLAKGY